MHAFVCLPACVWNDWQFASAQANCYALAGVQEPTGNAAVYLQYERVSLLDLA